VADILCVGNVVVDAVGVGVDEIPPEGSLALFDRVELHLGGCAANAAMSLGKMGLKVGLAAKVGNDGMGEFVRGVFEKQGVDCRGVMVSKDPYESTSYSFIMLPKSGNRRILHTLGANASLGPRDISPKLLKGAKWVATLGLTLLPGLFGKDLAAVLKAARKAGARTAGDTANNNRMADWSPAFKGCWEYFDVFFPSEEEARRIAGDRKPREICQYFRDQGVKIAGVKLGERGCAVLTADGYEEIPAYKVKAVDTLGAGDNFMAGFLAGMLKGRSPFDAARLGCATSAHCVQAVGATTGIPKLAKIEAFMRNRK